MDVVVTGGRGFVGMSVARALARGGATVWSVDRGPHDAWTDAFLAGESAAIRQLTADLGRPGDLARVLPLEKLDAVVHAAVVTATTTHVERAAARDIVDSNMGGTIEALQLATTRGATRRHSPPPDDPIACGP